MLIYTGFTMRNLVSNVVLVLAFGLLGGCSKSDTATSGAPHATISLRDGTSYAGTVTKSSPTQITVAGDDKSTRTFAMKDVKSVEYDEAPTQTAANPAGVPAEAPPPLRDHPIESAIKTKTYTLQAGTKISVRTDEPIDSGKGVEGQSYDAEVSRDVLDSAGDVVIPRGSNAHIVIRSASKGGRFKGSADLVLDLQSVSVDGRLYQLDTTDVARRGTAGMGKNKRTAEFVGGGAVVGTIIGAIAGHGKGAAIGAASGAAAGAATQVLTRGNSVRVPAESLLTFQLDKPLRVSPAR